MADRACPHGVVNGECNDCLVEQVELMREMLAEIVDDEQRDRWQHGMMRKDEADENPT
jgi:hypothetical protein